MKTDSELTILAPDFRLLIFAFGGSFEIFTL